MDSLSTVLGTSAQLASLCSVVLSYCWSHPRTVAHKYTLTHTEARAWVLPRATVHIRTQKDVSGCKNRAYKWGKKCFMFTRGDVMFGLDPWLTNWRAAVASISLLSFGSAICGVFLVLLKEQSSRSCTLYVCVCISVFLFVRVCCFQRWRHAHGDAALVAKQHRNVGGRISCP